MPTARSLFADILNQHATLTTFVELAEMATTQPDDVFIEFNELSMQSCLRIMDTFKEQSFLGRALLEIWLHQADMIESRNAQRYLCDTIAALASHAEQAWHQQSEHLSARLAEAAARLANMQHIEQQYTDVYKEYSSRQDDIAALEHQRKEIQQMQETLRILDQVDRVQLEQERGRLQMQHRDVEQQVTTLINERDQMQQQIAALGSHRDQIEQQVQDLRNQYDQKKSMSEEQLRAQMKPLQQRLEELVQFAARLSNPPVEGQTKKVPARYQKLMKEMEELKRLLLQGELRTRVENVYQQWNDLTTIEK